MLAEGARPQGLDIAILCALAWCIFHRAQDKWMEESSDTEDEHHCSSDGKVEELDKIVKGLIGEGCSSAKAEYHLTREYRLSNVVVLCLPERCL